MLIVWQNSVINEKGQINRNKKSWCKPLTSCQQKSSVIYLSCPRQITQGLSSSLETSLWCFLLLFDPLKFSNLCISFSFVQLFDDQLFIEKCVLQLRWSHLLQIYNVKLPYYEVKYRGMHKSTHNIVSLQTLNKLKASI